jgi:molybdenum cofactor cytidylyltransferase
MRSAGVADTLVVAGPHVQELVPLAHAAGANVLLLADETRDMRTTVEHGLSWLEKRFHPAGGEGWILLPADHPTLDGEVISQVLQARAAHPEATIVVPTYEGRRGHPAWIGWEHVGAIRTLPAGVGLNAYLREHIAATLQLPVADPNVLWDLDTPEDLKRLTDL